MPFRKGYKSKMTGMPHLSDADYAAKLKAKCVVMPTGCWEVQGFNKKGHGDPAARGYGGMYYRGKNWRSHRLAFFLATGSIDPKLDVMHSCDNPPCCNPAHLSQGTRRQNIRDAISRGRGHEAQRNREKTHCSRGHDYAETARLQPNKGGWVQRACVVCQRMHTRKAAGWPESQWFIPAIPKGKYRTDSPVQRGTEP